MRVYDFCRKMGKEQKIALNKWAKRLDAEEMTIHRDGTVTLTCVDGYICENYAPSARELSKA